MIFAEVQGLGFRFQGFACAGLQSRRSGVSGVGLQGLAWTPGMREL